MKAISTLEGQAVPLDRANVDTDQIIPKQFLKSIRRTGFGDYLFDGWRFEDEGQLGMTPNERALNRSFVLNQPEYQGARILLARDNFGCGSSREHAVWALVEYGFECVIAPSFADIFHNNCFKNGLLPIVLPEAQVEGLFSAVQADPRVAIAINLEAQTVTVAGDAPLSFEINPQRKHKLLNGLDDIQLTLEGADQIRTFEASYAARRPWLFPETESAHD